MPDRFDGLDELRDLIHALCEESITPEQMQRLEKLVLGNGQFIEVELP